MNIPMLRSGLLPLALPLALALLVGNTHAKDLKSPRSHAEETARISTHHLKRLEDRMTTPLDVLRESCRFVSDISTRPPAKKVALTFDDGPDPGQTEHILEVLKKHDVPATFFVIGHKASLYPDLIAEVRTSGRHLLGNHSWDHPNFHDISAAEQLDEVNKTEALLAIHTPHRLFRYPYGNSTCTTNQRLHERNYQIVGWHIDSCDWAFERSGSIELKEAISCGVLPQNRQDFVEHVVSAVRGHHGGIVLLHEIHPNTLRKLDEIITQLIADGFSFVSLDDPDFQASMR